MCHEAIEKWLNEKCEEVESQRNKYVRTMHKNIREIVGGRSCTERKCIKAKDGNIIVEQEEIIQRWSEYKQELFQNNRGNKPTINKDMEGTAILQSEVKDAVKKMKNNKSTGIDDIAVEEIKCLEEYGIEKLTEVLNEIYEKGEIPEELSKSIFITIPKKPGAIECELHRTISLMSHIMKILLKILMKRSRSKTKPEIAKVQCGFTEREMQFLCSEYYQKER